MVDIEGSIRNIYEFRALLKDIEKLLRGCNYHVTLCFAELSGCSDLAGAKSRIREIFPGSRPEELRINPVEEDSMWEDIDAGFNFRGDETSGLALDETGVALLAEMTGKYKTFIKKYLNNGAKFFFYPRDCGIPGYPVFWNYSFIILNADGRSVFLHGAASD